MVTAQERAALLEQVDCLWDETCPGRLASFSPALPTRRRLFARRVRWPRTALAFMAGCAFAGFVIGVASRWS